MTRVLIHIENVTEFMKRILIIGSSGAGKSTFAKRLHDKIGLELIHLDQYYWKPGWVKPETSEWEGIVKDLLKKESFIMDGNYRSTIDLRLPVADTIILLDPPRLVCFYRVSKRRFANNRTDEIAGCKERVSWNLLSWILWKYPQVARKDMLERIERVRQEKQIITLRTKKEIEDFLKE